MAYGSHIKKESKEITDLLEKISVLETKHKKNLDPLRYPTTRESTSRALTMFGPEN